MDSKYAFAIAHVHGPSIERGDSLPQLERKSETNKQINKSTRDHKVTKRENHYLLQRASGWGVYSERSNVTGQQKCPPPEGYTRTSGAFPDLGYPVWAWIAPVSIHSQRNQVDIHRRSQVEGWMRGQYSQPLLEEDGSQTSADHISVDNRNCWVTQGQI